MSYRISDQILWKIVDYEAVIVDQEKDEYYFLNRTGTEIWSSISKGEEKKKTVDGIAEKYKHDPATCSDDYDSIVTELLAEGLIEKVK